MCALKNYKYSSLIFRILQDDFLLPEDAAEHAAVEHDREHGQGHDDRHIGSGQADEDQAATR